MHTGLHQTSSTAVAHTIRCSNAFGTVSVLAMLKRREVMQYPKWSRPFKHLHINAQCVFRTRRSLSACDHGCDGIIIKASPSRKS